MYIFSICDQIFFQNYKISMCSLKIMKWNNIMILLKIYIISPPPPPPPLSFFTCKPQITFYVLFHTFLIFCVCVCVCVFRLIHHEYFFIINIDKTYPSFKSWKMLYYEYTTICSSFYPLVDIWLVSSILPL